MNELYSIGYVSSTSLGKDLASELLRVYPEGMDSASGFATKLHYKVDPKFQAVLTLFERAGWRARNELDPEHVQMTFRLNAVRQYDEEDLNSCEFLYLDLLHPKRGVSSTSRSPHGYAVMDIHGIPEESSSAICETPDAYVVPHEVRVRLESASLNSLAFKPTVVTARRSNQGPFISWEATGHQPWWELTSDRWMPSLSPATDLRRMSDQRPMTPRERDTRDYGRGIMPVEGPFRTPELHYARKDTQALSTYCDIARTYEPFGHRPESDRRLLVVSQRFYQLCRTHAIQAEWVPVRIDE